MGRLVVIEGLDGAGKNTLTRRLLDALAALGVRATTVAFPRYDADVHAELARDALHGRLGDVADSVHAMAVLFALDRRAAADDLRAAVAGHDLVLVDRYVASNAAYGAARLHQGACGEFVAWVHALEIERFGLPVPDRHLLLDVPRAVAAERAAHRERTEPGPRPRPLRVRRRACRTAPRRSTASSPRRAGWPRGRCSTGPRTSSTPARRLRSARRRPRSPARPAISRAFHELSVGGWDIACMKSRVLVVDDDPALAEMLDHRAAG